MWNNGAMSGQVYPPPPAAMAPQPQPHGQVAANNWAGNDANTLLVVATLITTLTYQLGCSVPGGYWQDTLPADGKQKPHEAGDPIMRDKHPQRYWVFMAASWMGFLASMMMTLSLLVRLPVDSRQVRWSFAVAYSSLVLTFIVSQAKTHISIDIAIWLVTVVFLWLMISVRPEHRARILRFFCCNREN
ncbi:uncharacterized protein LOC119292743 [Triticum dicoccoides]|uniref:PGG domain-containing protein n=3 Tax=Triticum TaxID=4564 RepID=A0A9R0T5H5_TRITD|nr:uncharacterized protein LOC119292743 [Triticum dicoccoides]XP_044372770.1 uncharacterized protein LOC123094991 [Triticum aestivum]VAI07589.1 unnamed protein product [Triticum turgidum subsp. durum]